MGKKFKSYFSRLMGRFIVPVLGLILLTAPRSAQAQSWRWVRNPLTTNVSTASYANQGNAIASDDAGNTYVIGSFAGTAVFTTIRLDATGGSGGNGGYYGDLFIAKYDSAGVCQWARKAGGNGNDEGVSIARASNGNVFVTGNFSGAASFPRTNGSITINSGGPNVNAVFVGQIDPVDGSFLWVTPSTSPTNTDAAKVNSLAVDNNDNVYITGSYTGGVYFGPRSLTSPSINRDDVFVAKLATAPARSWQWALSAGGTGYDYGYGITTDTSGNAYLTGSFTSSIMEFAAIQPVVQVAGRDVFVARINSSGTWAWAVSGGGSSDDIGNAITHDQESNLYITGLSTPGSSTFYGLATPIDDGHTGVLVAKLATSATAAVWKWAVIGGRSSFNNPGLRRVGGGQSICLDAAGAIYVGGTCLSSPTTRFGNTSALNSGIPTVPIKSDDAFVARLDTNRVTSPSGGWQWVASGGSLYNDGVQGIALDRIGNVYATGYTEENRTFFGGITVINNRQNLFTARLTRAGTGVSVITDFTPKCGPPGTRVTITGTGFSGNSITRFNDLNGVAPSNSPTTQVEADVPLDATSGPITVITDSLIAISAINFQVTPNGMATLAPTITPSSVGSSTLLTSSAASDNQWFFNGSPIPGATATTYLVASITQNGCYTVISTAGGCPSDFSAPQCVTITNIAAASPGATLAFYPNPVTDGRLVVELINAAQPLALTLFDALGRAVLTTATTGAETTLDTRALGRGVYLLRATTPDGRGLSRRVVVE